MYIKEIRVRNFRNHKDLILELSSGINFITGSNAVGKTNILEAISVTSNVRSFRNVSDTEIIKWGEESYYCCSTLEEARHTIFEIGCTFLSGKIKKRAKIDGSEKKKISDYYGRFLTVIFSPDDINIMIGSPEIRRRFFDGIISKVDEEYLSVLSDFKRILASRNRILKDLSENKAGNSTELDVWDTMFSEKAEFILNKRMDFLDVYKKTFRNAYLSLSGHDDPPSLEYSSTLDSTSSTAILEELDKYRKRDLFRGSTCAGPHRDDYSFNNYKGIAFKNCASQGQIRTASISLRIAESEFIERNTREKPVILIDDVFSELDESRRSNMLDNIKKNNQAIITSVNADLISSEKFGDIKNFIVESNGIVREK